MYNNNITEVILRTEVMRKYLVNYRVDISATSTIPYLEYTAIYETESMMTQEDVEAFEEAKTK